MALAMNSFYIFSSTPKFIIEYKNHSPLALFVNKLYKSRDLGDYTNVYIFFFEKCNYSSTIPCYKQTLLFYYN